jgi:ribosomal protein L37AE/L43A
METEVHSPNDENINKVYCPNCGRFTNHNTLLLKENTAIWICDSCCMKMESEEIDDGV